MGRLHRRSRVASLSASLAEERAEQRGGLVGQQPRVDPRAVIEARLAEDVEDAAGRARLRVRRREDDSRHPREHDRPGAHRAGLEGDVEDGVRDAPAAEPPRRRAQREDLGVRRGVRAPLPLVAGRADYLPLAHHDRADRDVAVLGGALGLAQGQAHELLVAGEEPGLAHGRSIGDRGAPGRAGVENLGEPAVLRDQGGSAPFMHTIGLRSALACAAVGLGVLALPQGAAAQRPYVPDEVVVGIEGEAPRVHRLAPGTGVGEAIAALERDPTVEFAQPNWLARASLAPLDRGTPGTPGGWAADQWSFLGKPGGIRVGRAWDRLVAAGAPGGAGTIVAVVDTGVAHVASAGGFLPSPDFGPGQFVPGIDIVDDDSAAVDENGHGTHVAGTIAEQVTLDQPAAVNDYLTGIAYGARLMPVRVLDRTGAGTATTSARGSCGRPATAPT